MVFEEGDQIMSILSIDPGICTGWALLDDEWEPLETGTCQPDGLEEALHPDSLHLNRFQIEATVIEETPIPSFSEMNRQLLDVMTNLRSWYPDAIFVRPGVWKNSPAYYISLSNTLTIHEKDAVRLGLYFLSTREVV